MTMIKFYYNGLKTGDHPKLQLCSYNADRRVHHAEGTITIEGKHYKTCACGCDDYHRDFSHEVFAAFWESCKERGFENDRIRVEPSHPLYPHVLKAWGAAQEHAAKQAAQAARRAVLRRT